MAYQPLSKRIRGEAYQLVIWQLVAIFLMALCALCVQGLTSSLSLLAGGLVYGLANLLFVWRVFRYAGPEEMVQFVTAFFLGEMLKLIISAFLFLMIVKYLPVSLLSVLAGFIGAIVSFWIVCLWRFSRKST